MCRDQQVNDLVHKCGAPGWGLRVIFPEFAKLLGSHWHGSSCLSWVMPSCLSWDILSLTGQLPAPYETRWRPKRPPTNDHPFPWNFLCPEAMKTGQKPMEEVCSPSGWRALLKVSLTLLSLESALPAQEVSLLSLQRPLLPQSFVLNKSSLLKLSVSGNSFPACASTTSSSQAVARCFRRKCCSSLSPPSPSFSPASPGSLWQGPSLKPDKEDWRKLPLPSSPLFLSAIQRRPLASKSPEAC